MISLFRIFTDTSLIKKLRGLAILQQTIGRVRCLQCSAQFAHVFGGHTSFHSLCKKLGLQVIRKGLPFPDSLVRVGSNCSRSGKTCTQSSRKIGSHKTSKISTSLDITTLCKREQYRNFQRRHCDPNSRSVRKVNVTHTPSSRHSLSP